MSVSFERPTGRPISKPPTPTGRVDNAVLLLCGLAWASGIIHIHASIDHLQESVVHAAFFVALASAQFGWGAVLYRSPTARLVLFGAGGSVAVALLWLVSRTIGLPIGPEAWTPEPVGILDVVATVDEIMLALLGCERVGLIRYGARPNSQPFLTAAALGVMLLSCVALVPGGHAH